VTCDCIEVVNEKLKERNTALAQPLVLGDNPAKLLVETYQIETGRGKPKAVSIFASCCPFCGVRYEKSQVAA
jgi:hypothetical protein